METYAYKAVGADGKEKKGSMQADSRDEVAAKLKEDNLIPLSIGTQSVLDTELSFGGERKKKISARDMSVFCRQFSSILRAGVNVINALEMLGEQTENKTLRVAIKEVQSGVEKGDTLAKAMQNRDGVFPPLLINMVEAGEASGSLDTSIERMAIQFEKDAKIRGMVKKAMMYPIILCIVAIGVVIVMMAFVIPSFMTMFEDIGSDLPAFTKAIVAMSNFIVNRWYILVGAVVAVVVAYKTYAKTDDGAKTLAKIQLKIPVFGSLVTKTACSRFARTMSTLLAAGMPMMDALEITANTMDNLIYKETIQKIKNGVGLGLELSGQLRSAGIFPSMLVHMTGIGEETGSIEEMLTNVANYYDEEVELATQQLTSLMEPIIILVMAGVVCCLIMAIYGPMITLYDTLG